MQRITQLLLICAMASFVALPQLGCDKVNETRARRIANKAVRYMREKQYSKAAVYLKKALALNPLDGKIRYLLGRTYEAMNDTMKAEREYKRSVHVDGKNHQPHLQLGGIYLKWKKYAKASTHYEKAVKINPKHLYSVYQLGIAYHKQKRFAAAAAQFNKAISMKPNFIPAYNNLALVYYDQAEKARLELGDDQAIPHYAKAASAVSRAKAAGVANEQSYNTLGLVYQKQKKFEQAIAAFHQASKVRPHFSIAAYNRGATYDLWLEEQFKAATEVKGKAKTKEIMQKAAVYRDKAIKAFKEFLQLHQGNQGLRMNVREKIMKLKQMQEKEMFKRIKRERREARKLKRRRR